MGRAELQAVGTVPDDRRDFLNAIDHNGVSAKGARRIEQIVQTGADMLLRHGLWAVNKRRIANELGISDGNVGYYFPTRKTLWSAIVHYELDEYYRRHQLPSQLPEDDHRGRFDEYILRYVGEYQDRFVRIFFSQILTVAEVNESIAEFRDQIYEGFLALCIERARPLVPELDEQELEQRALLVVALLEGLHAVSAFRPNSVRADENFRQRILAEVHTIIGDDEAPGAD
jgi:AcrR family transcriptional regulator